MIVDYSMAARPQREVNREGDHMNQLLHVSSATVKETEDGNVSTITLGAVSINPSELIQLVGEQVILRTPGQKGRSFGGGMTALLVKDGKHGPEVTVKVQGPAELNGLVGTNVTIEAAQITLPVGMSRGPGGVQVPTDPSLHAAGKAITAKREDEPAQVTTQDDLENF
jgi:hypothetical protein